MSEPAKVKRDPNFGRDPWIGPVEPLGPDPEKAAYHLARPDHPRTVELMGTSAPVYAGADTLSGDIQYLPAGLAAYFSYKDNYEGYDSPPGTLTLVKRFPTGVVAGLPWGYTSSGNMASLIATGGNRDYVKWGAHYGHGPHICAPHVCGYPQVHWTQWDDHGAHGENIDRSCGIYLPAGLGPRPLLVPITIFGHVPSLCADMEPGAMQIGAFGPWYDHIALHPHPIEPPILIDLEEDVSDLSAVTKHKQGEQERVHIYVTIAKDKTDPTKGCTLYEVYQEPDGANWVGGKPGKQKALAYRLTDVPSG